MRTPAISRLYLQCRPDEDLADWPDHRIWDEMQTRFRTAGGFRLTEGPVVQKGVTGMRSFVAEPMQPAASSSPAMRPTSCRPPAPRA